MRRLLAQSLFAVLATSLHAQVPSDWQSRLPEEAALAVVALVVEAADEGLPVEPLIQKALEGAAKGVEGRRIVAAVRIYRAGLRDARFLLSSRGPEGAPSSDATVAVALALQRGLPLGDILELLAAAGEDELEPALYVACDILARGYAPSEATALVGAALASLVSESTLRALPRAVSFELQRGATRGEALNRVRAQFIDTRPGRVP